MAIAAHDITIKEFGHPFRLLDFQMELKPNAHGFAKLHLRLNNPINLHKELKQDTVLSIGYATKEDVENILFCGVVANLSMKRENQYYELFIELTTGSSALDRVQKQVAYQDNTMTYAQVVTHALSKTTDAKTIVATKNDRQIEQMLVQYKETDWAFAKRLASHLEDAIFPDWRTGNPAFYFGTSMNTGTAVVITHDYTTVLDPRFYEQGGFLTGNNKRDFSYIQTETDIDYTPGTVAQILGTKRRAMYKHATLQGDEIQFIYHWYERYKIAHQYNEELIGTMLAGTVLETVDERVKLLLDIDAVNATILHPWTPTTGNLFYCMPELGSRVMLYLGSRLDHDTKVMENIRENSGVQLRAETVEQEERNYHGRLLDPDNRYFASQHEKELSILPTNIGLGPREMSPKIAIVDQSAVMIDDLTLTLQANGAIAFQGDSIRISEPSQVSMVRSGNGPMSTFNISKDFNICGTIGSMEGTQKEAMQISRSSVVETLGNPDEIEKIAIATLPLQILPAKKEPFEALQHEAENILEISHLADEQMQKLALSLVPLGN